MKNRMQICRTIALSGVAALALVPNVAFAQENSDEEDEGNIVVIGTLIRNTEAVGSQTITVDQEAIAQQGANSTNQILSMIPQVTNTFNGRFEGDPRGVGAGISIVKPNLRELPGFNSSSGGVTLVLVDGFRLTPVGVNQSAIDVDVIPAAVLEGVDALTDGGTSLYGADAVGGVINFRTLRSFDGIKMDVNYGFGDTISAHQEYDANLTVGTSWNGGNAYISGGYAHRDLILNGDTDWAVGNIYSATGVSQFGGTQCLSPVGTETRWFRFGPGADQFTNNPLAPGAGTFAVGTACDQFAAQTYLPAQTRYNAYAALRQNFADNVDLRVTAYYTQREQLLGNYPRGFTSAGSGITSAAQLTTAFPAALLINPGSRFAVAEGTGFSFGANAAYPEADDDLNRTAFQTWGVTPELTVGITDTWQLRTTAHFGRSHNDQDFLGVNDALARSSITAGTLNPRNVAAASASLVTQILDFAAQQDTNHQSFVARTVLDGPLFTLPGGDVSMAVGAEYRRSRAATRIFSGPIGGGENQAFRVNSQTAKSVFGELVVPVTDFLELAGSVRYDDYNDFGSTTNPSIGASFTPLDWLKIYGHWNTSYNAPTALDGLGQALGRTVCGIYGPATRDMTTGVYTFSTPNTNRPFDPSPFQDTGAGSCALLAEGSTPGLRPQTAESWALGIELTPAAGFNIGGQFYSIDFSDILAAVNPANLNTYITNPEFYIYNPSATYFTGLLAQLSNAAAIDAAVDNTDIALFVDRRTTNQASAIIEGIDFHANYNLPTDFGDIAFGLNGNVSTREDVTTGGVTVDDLPNTSDFTATFFTALNAGGFSSRVTVNYSGGIDNDGPLNTGVNASLGSFIQTNLFLGYEFEEGMLGGTSFRVTVDNLLDAQPTETRRSSGSLLSYSRWTLGRVIKFGVSRRF